MPVFRFSTDRLPKDMSDGARARIWAEGMQRFGFTFTCPNENGFRGDVEHVVTGPLDLSWASASSAVAARAPISADHDGGGPDFILFANMCDRPKLAAQRGRNVWLDNGDLALLDHAEPHVTAAHHGGRAMTFRVRRATLEASGIDIRRAICRPIPAESTAARLFRGYAETVLRAPPEDEGMATTVAAHLLDMAILALGGHGDAMERARRRGLEALRVKAIRGAIARGCSDPQFDVVDIAGQLGLSVRSIQASLGRVGTTVSDEVTTARLELARNRLASRDPDRETVTRIAFDVGFNSLSTFYRAFRSRYGHPPGEKP